MLVVVGALAAVVSQVKRLLHCFVAAGVVGLVAGGAPLGVHVVHRSFSSGTWLDESVIGTGRDHEEPHDGDASTHGSRERKNHRVAGRAYCWGGARRGGLVIYRLSRDVRPVNAEHRDEVASLQVYCWASPRRTISTKTLRMVRTPYAAPRPCRGGAPDLFIR
jgi:hypothetical protein